MINSIETAILKALQVNYPLTTYKYYIDNIPQDYVKPAFYLKAIDTVYDKRLDKKYRSTITFDLSYYSELYEEDIIAECIDIQISILRILDFAGIYKILNKNARITDNVLHVTFDVAYSEMVTETGTPMQSQTTNTNIEEV